MHVKETEVLFFLTKAIGYNFPKVFTCLPLALSSKSFLAKNTDFKLTIGVNNENKGFEAHAWITHKDKIVLGDLPNQSFVPLWHWE